VGCNTLSPVEIIIIESLLLVSGIWRVLTITRSPRIRRDACAGLVDVMAQ
jgi:hypothetical protein